MVVWWLGSCGILVWMAGWWALPPPPIPQPGFKLVLGSQKPPNQWFARFYCTYRAPPLSPQTWPESWTAEQGSRRRNPVVSRTRNSPWTRLTLPSGTFGHMDTGQTHIHTHTHGHTHARRWIDYSKKWVQSDGHFHMIWGKQFSWGYKNKNSWNISTKYGPENINFLDICTKINHAFF